MSLLAKPIAQMSLAELGDELRSAVEQSREIVTMAGKEGRTEETLLDTEVSRIETLLAQIEPIKKLQASKTAFLAKLQSANADQAPGRITPGQFNRQQDAKAASVMWSPTRSPMMKRQHNLSEIGGSADYHDKFLTYMKGGSSQALMAGSAGSMQLYNDEKGGVFVLPEIFSTELIKNVDDACQIQAMSRVIMQPAGALSYSFRMRKTKANTFQWTGDPQADQTGNQDQALAYGKRTMTPHPIQGQCIIGKELMRNWPQAESMVHQELQIDLGEKLERAYLTGDGHMKPLGVLVNHADGISAGRNTVSAAVAQAGYDDFVKQKYSLKPQYRAQASWLLHRLMLQDLALLKDTQGRPLWQPSMVVGQPDTILGLPLGESEFMPSTKASGAFFSILGAWQYYYILFDMGMSMQRLDEIGAMKREYIYLFFLQIDAQPMLEEAFSRGIYQ